MSLATRDAAFSLVRRDEGGEEHSDIVLQFYWDAVNGDRLPLGLDYFMFDLALANDQAVAVQWLQQVLNVPITHGVDMTTLAALDLVTADVVINGLEMLWRRRARSLYSNLSDHRYHINHINHAKSRAMKFYVHVRDSTAA